MPSLCKWLLAAFTLIGAALGAGLTLWILVPPLLRQEAVAAPIVLIFVGVTALYVLGGVAAVRFALDPARRRLLRYYYALQVVALASPMLEFRFFSGAHLLPTLDFQPWRVGFGLDFWLGSTWQVQFNSDAHWALGVNLVAVAVLWWLRERPRRDAPGNPVGNPATHLASNTSANFYSVYSARQ